MGFSQFWRLEVCYEGAGGQCSLQNSGPGWTPSTLFKFLVAQEAFGPGRQKSRLSPSAHECLLSVSVSRTTMTLNLELTLLQDFPNGSSSRESACNAGDTEDVCSIPELGRSPGGRNSNPLQYSYLENPMDRGA